MKDIISNRTNAMIIESFTLTQYFSLIDTIGLSLTWDRILNSINSQNGAKLQNNKYLNYDNLGELYEIGLAYANKIDKKETGKYFTPSDVCQVMAQLLLENRIEKLADVGCGTGNLVIEVLRQIRDNNLFDIMQFIKKGNLYLYDSDEIALKICLKKISLLLNDEHITQFINVIQDDFLKKNVLLPLNVSVITNPPYAIIKKMKTTWGRDDVLSQAKDLYAGFISKITDYCENAVIVSPQSYLVSEKFSLLRKKMGNNFYGEIFSFDNVPGTLFSGRKHGIFNTNSANGVRASITSIKRNGHKGFNLTHLIRFKTAQRKEVINLDFLRSKLGTKIQLLEMPIKSFKELEDMVAEIIPEKRYLLELIEENSNLQDERFKLYISTSARYFTIASKKELRRRGYFVIYAKDEGSFELLYSLINSSYVYMWWRFLDGGILLTKRHLLATPYLKKFFSKTKDIDQLINEMISLEEKYSSYKKNAGQNQESIKFPIAYRQKINSVFFPKYAKHMELLHNNYEVSEV